MVSFPGKAWLMKADGPVSGTTPIRARRYRHRDSDDSVLRHASRQAGRRVKTASHVPSTGLAACVGLSYSELSACTGLTDEARCAGIKLASNAESASTAATPASVERSHACTPKSRLRISVAAATEHASPVIIPIPVNHPASFKIR